MNSPHWGQWRGALMLYLICTWIKAWLSEQSWGWWFETPSCSLWRHCNDQPRSAGSMAQGSIRKRSAVHNFAPKLRNFCVIWEGLSLPHDTIFGNYMGENVDRRVIFSWSLISDKSGAWSRITVTSQMTPWRLKSPATRRFIKLFALTNIKEISNSASLALCEGNSPATGEFPAQRASDAEKASIWWRHHGFIVLGLNVWHVKWNKVYSFKLNRISGQSWKNWMIIYLIAARLSQTVLWHGFHCCQLQTNRPCLFISPGGWKATENILAM